MPVATSTLDALCVNTIRGLSMDGVQAANSGHPGLPMGAAPMAYSLWTRHLRHNPKDPHWFNRDRFILSAGHGSMLLYSLLHLTGYDLPLDELKKFRQWGSKTPGHPENLLTPGVEMATGPLGQGFATSVGYAIAEAHLAAIFNKPGHDVIDHYTYGICSDGDMMEGVTSEAASLAGHLGLGKLIFLYDSNGITIDGSTDITFTEDIEMRFKAYGWHVQKIDGMDIDAVDRALTEAEKIKDKPSFIIARTIIGYGSPHREGTPEVHGKALGADELKLAKEALGIPLEPTFYEPEDAVSHFREAVSNGAKWQEEWNAKLAAYTQDYPAEAKLLKASIAGDWGTAWIDALPTFTDKLATRKSAEAVMDAIMPHLPTFIGGSADLWESNMTHLKDAKQFQPESHEGRNLAFGIREHAMVAAVNGITRHGGLRAFGSTFLIFSDYCRPSLRLAALMECPSIIVFTHDSIGLGEDGPTHQSIEQLTSLRVIPNMNVLRPADGNEASACWKIAVESTETPCLFALSRQALPALTPDTVKNHPAEKGGYVLRPASKAKPDCVLVATGSEVQHAVAAKDTLEAEGISTQVVSMPSTFLYDKQSAAYKESVLPKGVPTVSIEAGATLGWYKYAQAFVGIDHFGASAPTEVVMKEFGFTPENVVAVAKKLLGR